MMTTVIRPTVGW